MVYAVCSVEPEENEEVIQSFLNQHPKFHIDRFPDGLPPPARELIDTNGYFKTYPHLHNMDGFFSVCLRKAKADD